MNGDWNERIFKRKKQKKETVEEIDLIPLFKAVVSKWWLIVIFAVVLGMVSYFVTDTFVTPTYRSGFTAYVNNRSGVTASGTEATGSKKLTTSDITASQSLVKTYSKSFSAVPCSPRRRLRQILIIRPLSFQKWFPPTQRMKQRLSAFM